MYWSCPWNAGCVQVLFQKHFLLTEKCSKLLQTMFRFSLSEHLGHHCCCIVSSLRDVRKESAGYVLSQADAKPSHPAQTHASFGAWVQILLISVTWFWSSYTQLWVHMCILKYILWVWLLMYLMSFEGATLMSSWSTLTFSRHLGCSKLDLQSSQVVLTYQTLLAVPLEGGDLWYIQKQAKVWYAYLLGPCEVQYYNKKCFCMSNDFTAFWGNSLV
jgi:hypothetical protein